MSHITRDVPPPLELLCLKALWSLEEGSVKDVRGIVAQSRPLAYTTIMTVLDRLVRKGKLTRRKVGRAFLFAPTESRDAMRRLAVRELLEGFFDGSEEELARYLQGARPISPAPSAPAPAVESGIDPVLL
jgi:BlaI family transcriptional regulator, penicillinase repressor